MLASPSARREAGAGSGPHSPLCGIQCVRQPRNRTGDCAGYFPTACASFLSLHRHGAMAFGPRLVGSLNTRRTTAQARARGWRRKWSAQSLCGIQRVRQPRNRTGDCAGYFPTAYASLLSLPRRGHRGIWAATGRITKHAQGLSPSARQRLAQEVVRTVSVRDPTCPPAQKPHRGLCGLLSCGLCIPSFPSPPWGQWGIQATTGRITKHAQCCSPSARQRLAQEVVRTVSVRDPTCPPAQKPHRGLCGLLSCGLCIPSFPSPP